MITYTKAKQQQQRALLEKILTTLDEVHPEYLNNHRVSEIFYEHAELPIPEHDAIKEQICIELMNQIKELKRIRGYQNTVVPFVKKDLS